MKEDDEKRYGSPERARAHPGTGYRNRRTTLKGRHAHQIGAYSDISWFVDEVSSQKTFHCSESYSLCLEADLNGVRYSRCLCVTPIEVGTDTKSSTRAFENLLKQRQPQDETLNIA